MGSASEIIMSTFCNICGIKWIRNISLNSTWDLIQSPWHRDCYALAFDFDLKKDELGSDIKYWYGNEWKKVSYEYPRFWLPFKYYSYEEAMVEYISWTHEAKKEKEQLLVYYADDGCVSGDEKGPWFGDIRMGAFRGEFLDFIEPYKDDDTMRWMKLAQQWTINPKTKYMHPYKLIKTL